jgi:hypothetical protein
MVLSFIVTPYPKTELFDLAMRLHPERMAGIDLGGTDYALNPCANLSEVSDETLKAFVYKIYPALFLNPFRVFRLVRDYPRPWSVWRYWRGVFDLPGHGETPAGAKLYRNRAGRAANQGN